MAYDLQAEFERGALSAAGLMERIEKETDGVWRAVAPLLEEPA